jgi:hypothetical protein
MILPEKHISLSESILGLGGFLLSYIDKPVTVDELWIKFNQSVKDKEYPKYHSFDNLILALDFLFLLDAVQLDTKGRLIRAIN